MSLDELQKAVLESKITVGATAVLKALREGKIKKIFLSSNCPQNIKSDISHYAQQAEVDVEELSQASDEVSLLCKKNFFVSVVAY